MKLLVEADRDLPLVSFAVTLRGGRVHEPEDKAGLARITARMLRRGCRDGDRVMDAEAIEQRIDALGGELGVHVGMGATTVSCEVLSRNLDPMLALVSALLSQPTFDDAELGKLIRQSEAELVRSRENDGLLCGRALRRHLFAGHPHGKRVSGTLAGIRSITRGDVVGHHARHVVKAEAIVSVAGDIDGARAEALCETLAAALPAGSARGYPVDEPAPPRGRRLCIVDKPGRTQTQIAIGTLGTHPRDPDHTALSVANTAFGGTFTSRMVDEIRSQRGWSYGASSMLSTALVRESFSMWTAPGVDDAAACLALQLDMLRQWHDEGIDQEELDFCKAYLRRSYAFERDTARKRVHQALERALLGLPDDWHDRYVERVEAVTLAQANDAVRARIDPDGLWVAVVGSAAELEAPLRDAMADIAGVVVEPVDLE